MSTKRKHVLLVDDDERDYEITRGMLARIPSPGYKLDWETDPDIALIAIAEKRYDAVLVDYRLGRNNGLEVVREATARGYDLPWIVLTGCGTPEVDAAALEAGAADFLVKGDISPAILDRTLRFVVRQREAERQLRRSRAEAEAANRAKDRFLAVLSHELRTPLTPILVASSTALEGSIDPTIRPMLEMIKRNIEIEARLVDDLLDIARIERGEFPLTLIPTDIHDVVRRAVEVCKQECRLAGLTVRTDLSATTHHAKADPTRLLQLCWNLVRNAARFTLPGGILEIRSYNADGSSGNLAGRLVIEFHDDGIGIHAKELTKIFEPFERGLSAEHVRHAGLGLGLAIARSVAESHGGTLTATSLGTGHGSTFRLELPAISTSARPRPTATDSAPTYDKSKGLRILLVEDNADTRRYTAMALRLRGHRVMEAANLQAAREAAAGPVDLLISDIELPDGTGLELMRELAPRGIHGVALSGFGSEDDIRMSRAAGFSAHLTKPFEIGRLDSAVRTYATCPEQTSAA